jgi:aspartyl-tRNA(Asn)/glutamyl-tRNA(Gln) amidotransferase subunit A
VPAVSPRSRRPAFLQRAQAQHAQLGALPGPNPDGRWPQARAADARARRRQRRPAEGVPLAHKDIFVTDFASFPTTAGSPHAGRLPLSPFDATVVAKLAAAAP